MKKVIYSIAAVGLLAASFGGGWVLSSSLTAKQTRNEVYQASKEAVSPRVTDKFVDIASGTGMDPSELYAELQNRSGQDFDSQYMAYAIVMRNAMTGMNRLAKENAENSDLKAKANSMWSYDSQTTAELYALQKILGYTDH